MRRITISVLSIFVVLPAIAGGRLPVVNIASGGVSARAAFGEADTKPVAVAAVAQKKQASPTRTRRVVARSATATPAVDAGEKIVASNDVLSPRRPSNDLWAKSDSALRMPMPSEFSVIRTDSVLPEESLDQSIAVAAPVNKSVAPVAETVAPAPRGAITRVAPTTAPAASESELDTQIARLAQLQKRADDRVRTV